MIFLAKMANNLFFTTMKNRFCLAITFLLGAIGCSVEVLEVVQDDDLKLIFEASPFLDGDMEIDTRTSVVPNESYSNFQFIWSAKDTVGIYPDVGSQVYFTMENGAGASTATFDGGGWACKDGYVYRSYFPFHGNIYLDKTQIPVSFIGQKQIGNDHSEHFQKYDYMFTAATTKSSGLLSFSYHHLVTVVLPWVELPAGHYTNLTLSLNEPLFITEGKYDLTANSPAIIGKKYSNSISIELDVTFTSADILKVYVPLAPINLTGKVLTITITDKDGREFQYNYNPSKPYDASKVYRLRSATSFVEPVISFADEAVKAICVSRWDTNGDGELSLLEAAAVKSLSSEVFSGNTVITSFDEFQFFTGLTGIPDGAFEGCYNLASIIIPESITDIYGYALYGVPHVYFNGLTAPVFHKYHDDEDEYYACFSNDAVLHVKPKAYSSFTSTQRDAFVGNVIVDVPNNEVWYISSNNVVVDISAFSETNPFGANLTSNTNSDGIGRMVFDAPVGKAGRGAFKGSEDLISVFLPESVKTISSSAFGYCSNLNTVALPMSLGTIGWAAFESCGLQSIVLPSSARIIDDSTQPSFNPSLIPFNLSYNMRAVFQNGKWQDRLIQDNTLIEVLPYNTFVTIYDVPTIGPWAAGNCSRLQSVVIGPQCSVIGESAFRNCTSLTSIKMDGSTPPQIATNVFENTNNCQIIVPASSVSAYKSAWPEYASRIIAQ